MSLFEKRFIIVPRLLAALLHIVTMAGAICLAFEANHSGWTLLSLLTSMLILGFIWVLSKLNQGFLGQKMVRYRIWLWGKDKFSTWEGLHKWFLSKSPQDIESILLMETVKDIDKKLALQNHLNN